MGAVVVRKENETNVPLWLQKIRYEAKSRQSTDLHFRKLSDRQKRVVCSETAQLHMRMFTVISNKRNMRQHKNRPASYISQHKHWFYWWITRLILERVTQFCADQNALDGTPGRRLQIEFSRRKDLKRHEFTDYFTRISMQGKSSFLNKRQIDWSIFDFQNVHFYDHETRAGLQFADILASAFYQAVNTHPHGSCCPDYGKLLQPRIHRPQGKPMLDEGFTVWPYSLIDANLTDDQKAIFRYYGYPERRLTK